MVMRYSTLSSLVELVSVWPGVIALIVWLLRKELTALLRSFTTQPNRGAILRFGDFQLTGKDIFKFPESMNMIGDSRIYKIEAANDGLHLDFEGTVYRCDPNITSAVDKTVFRR